MNTSHTPTPWKHAPTSTNGAQEDDFEIILDEFKWDEDRNRLRIRGKNAKANAQFIVLAANAYHALREELEKCLLELEKGTVYDRQDEIRKVLEETR